MESCIELVCDAFRETHYGNGDVCTTVSQSAITEIHCKCIHDLWNASISPSVAYYRFCPSSRFRRLCATTSLLDAATNDLAQLINRLDLQALPDTSPMSGRSPSSFASPHARNPTNAWLLKALLSPALVLRSCNSTVAFGPLAFAVQFLCCTNLQTALSATVVVIREATVRLIILLSPKLSDRIHNDGLLRHLPRL